MSRLKKLSIDVFATKVSIWNAIGYCFSVGIPTTIDPLLKHHVKYGARTYPLGYLALLLSFLVFYLTYKTNVNEKFSGNQKTILTLLSLLLPAWLMLPNFLPEFPHVFVFTCPLAFAGLSAYAVYLHNAKIEFNFISDNSIDKLAKIERIKMEREEWFRSALGLLSVYGLIAISLVIYARAQ
jgi:hypothetical protein